jgi:signal transduction histidine kinase
MIKKAQNSNIEIIFLAAITTLIFFAFLSYTKIQNLIDESELINHATVVKFQLEKTFVALIETESNRRGYMLTKDSTFFYPLEESITKINLEIDAIDSLTKDNPLQQQNAIVLRAAINDRLEMLQNNFILWQSSKPTLHSRLKAKVLMDDIGKLIDKMKNEEDKLLLTRIAAFDKSASVAPIITIGLITSSIIILILLYFKILRDLKIANSLKSNLEQQTNELFETNKELAFQNEEKEKRAAELVNANKELTFQNEEKVKRAAELVIANKELAFQNEEKEKRAAELVNVNKELESFNYISSHDLQEPLRKIRTFASRLIADESQNLSYKGKDYVLRMEDAASRMQALIVDLLAYSRTTSTERKFETANLNTIMESVKKDLADIIAEKNAIIEVEEMCDAHIIPFQFRQLMDNIIGNALKFAKPDLPPHIIVKSRIIKGSEINNQKLLPEKEYCHITVTDNGIGFEQKYQDYIFELFKRLHDKEKIKGTGIGLTIVKKIVANHNGLITATSELNKGATFDIYIPQ